MTGRGDTHGQGDRALRHGSGPRRPAGRRRRPDQADPHPPPPGDEAARREVRDAHRPTSGTPQTFDEAGIEVLLVGDSASNNVFANETSLPVTVDELIPLARAVSRSRARALVVADLPFRLLPGQPEQASSPPCGS